MGGVRQNALHVKTHPTNELWACALFTAELKHDFMPTAFSVNSRNRVAWVCLPTKYSPQRTNHEPDL